ncbi:MAG: ABC transporter permease [Caldimicrobium sp.]
MRLNRFFIMEVLKELLANKVNLFFIILALTFSLTALNTIYALGKSAEKQILDYLANLNFGKDAALVLAGGRRIMGLMVTRTDTLKMEDVRAIEKFEFVKMVSPFLGGVIEVSSRGKVEKLRVDGVLPIYSIANNWQVIKGRFINEEDVKKLKRVAVLGAEIEKKMGLKNPIGEKIKIGDQYYTIIGVLEKKGSLGNYPLDERILVPLSTAQRRIFNVDYIRGFKIVFFEGTDLNQAVKTIRKLLRARHHIDEFEPDDFRIITPDMAVERFTRTSRTLSAFLLSIALISLVISGVIIMNLMTASVEEKAGIIALRIAIGATKRDILSHYLFSALFIAGICGVIGWIISLFLMKVISLFTSLKPLFSWGTFFLSLGFSFFTCIIFSIFPALKATKVEPAILLKSL